jgi:hypothetical protein
MSRPSLSRPVATARKLARTFLTVTILGGFALAQGVSAQPATAPAKARKKIAVTAAATATGESAWRSLFDGKTLNGWKETDFSTRAGAAIEKLPQGGPAIIIEQSDMLSGISYTNTLPTMNYEVALEAMKLQGSDFFCGLTFPVGESHCTLILGGWGGAVVGLSSIDGSDASENETTKFIRFDNNVWYRVRVRVTPQKIEAWLDDEQIADVETAGRKISMRPGEIEESKPFGIATWQTRAAMRNIRLKLLQP